MNIPTTYIDKFGSIETEILNDGKKLILEIEGIKFTSIHFDDFEIEDISTNHKRFSLNTNNELNDCRLICKVPLTLIRNDKEIQTSLILDITLDHPNLGWDYKTKCSLSLIIANKLITTRAESIIADFELGLIQIIEQLTEGYQLKCCFGCAFADYSVYGQSLFGTMLCFKNIKEKYLMVKDKTEYIDIMDSRDREVQETYLCEEFQTRKKGTGYRG